MIAWLVLIFWFPLASFSVPAKTMESGIGADRGKVVRIVKEPARIIKHEEIK